MRPTIVLSNIYDIINILKHVRFEIIDNYYDRSTP